eukprot:gene1608-2246_t
MEQCKPDGVHGISRQYEEAAAGCFHASLLKAMEMDCAVACAALFGPKSLTCPVAVASVVSASLMRCMCAHFMQDHMLSTVNKVTDARHPGRAHLHARVKVCFQALLEQCDATLTTDCGGKNYWVEGDYFTRVWTAVEMSQIGLPLIPGDELSYKVYWRILLQAFQELILVAVLDWNVLDMANISGAERQSAGWAQPTVDMDLHFGRLRDCLGLDTMIDTIQLLTRWMKYARQQFVFDDEIGTRTTWRDGAHATAIKDDHRDTGPEQLSVQMTTVHTLFFLATSVCSQKGMKNVVIQIAHREFDRHQRLAMSDLTKRYKKRWRTALTKSAQQRKKRQEDVQRLAALAKLAVQRFSRDIMCFDDQDYARAFPHPHPATCSTELREPHPLVAIEDIEDVSYVAHLREVYAHESGLGILLTALTSQAIVHHTKLKPFFWRRTWTDRQMEVIVETPEGELERFNRVLQVDEPILCDSMLFLGRYLTRYESTSGVSGKYDAVRRKHVFKSKSHIEELRKQFPGVPKLGDCVSTVLGCDYGHTPLNVCSIVTYLQSNHFIRNVQKDLETPIMRTRMCVKKLKSRRTSGVERCEDRSVEVDTGVNVTVFTFCAEMCVKTSFEVIVLQGVVRLHEVSVVTENLNQVHLAKELWGLNKNHTQRVKELAGLEMEASLDLWFDQSHSPSGNKHQPMQILLPVAGFKRMEHKCLSPMPSFLSGDTT